MPKDFLYCEETDTKIYPNDVVSISTYPDTKWIAKQGWYTIGSARKHGWYFISILDKTILSIELVDIKDISKDKKQGTSEVRPEISVTSPEQDTPKREFLYCDITGVIIYPNDIVTISTRPNIIFIAK